MKRRPTEGGFTLPELLVSIVILGLIVGPLTAATIFVLRNDETSTNVFGDNTTARLTKMFFTADVQSANDIDIVTDDTGQCGTGTPIVTMAWTKNASDYTSSWYQHTPLGEAQQLVRHLCQDGPLVAENHLGAIAAADYVDPVLTITALDGFVFTVSATSRVSA